MRAQVIAVTAALALMVSACSGDEPPPPDPTSAATTPAKPTASLPPMPAQARKFTAPGVSTFVRHYVQVMGAAVSTGDVTGPKELSDPGCEGCTEYIKFIEDTYAGGGFLRQSWSAAGESTVRFNAKKLPDTESFVTTKLRISAGKYRAAGSKRVVRTKLSKDTVTFGLRYTDRWVVTQLWSGDYE